MAYYRILLLFMTAYFCCICYGEEEIKAEAYIYFTDGFDNTPPSIYVGSVIFTQTRGTPTVKLSGNLAFPKEEATVGKLGGQHGFHIHEIGSLGHGCMDAKGHYNPTKMDHGGPMNSERHVGDLGNVQILSNGSMPIKITDDMIQLYGMHSIIGRALVIHQNRDDLGMGNASDSLTTGHAGTRIACGIIGVASENYVPGKPCEKEKHVNFLGGGSSQDSKFIDQEIQEIIKAFFMDRN